MKSHPTRTPRARSVRARLMKADIAAALLATRARAEPLLRGVVRVMTDMEVIDAMDGLVQLMCKDREAQGDEVYNALCANAWIGVREYVSAYARRDSGVFRGVPAKSAKKRKR